MGGAPPSVSFSPVESRGDLCISPSLSLGYN